MEYLERIKCAKKRAGRLTIVSICFLVLATLIIGIVGKGSREERTSKTMEELIGTRFERIYYKEDVHIAYEWEIEFEKNGTGSIVRTYTSETLGICPQYGAFEYYITYDFFGIQNVVMDINWIDEEMEDVQKKHQVGRNEDGEIVVLAREEEFLDDFAKDGKGTPDVITYDNQYLKSIWNFFVILTGITIIAGIWNIIATKKKCKKEQEYKIHIEKMRRIDYKRKSLEEYWKEKMDSLGYKEEDTVTLSNGNLLWIFNEKLYEAENMNRYVERYLNKNTEQNAVAWQYISVNCIQCYSKEGDVQYTTKISGGDGGGSSIKGAIVGGLLAGEVGAIIGSRKKVNEIKSEAVTHDSRRTLIRYYEKQELLTISYEGLDVYEFLLKKIPEKDLLSMQLSNKPTNEKKMDDVEQKLLMIQNIYEKNLITKEEFDKKREEILKNI